LTGRGLNGEGQTIGIADTGLDIYHCFFYDDSKDVPYQRNRMDNNPDTGHRKIAAYWAYMDKIDSAGGHGTHVVSSSQKL
jgi:subtilisin family serine protease